MRRVVLLTVAMVLVLAGCGSSGGKKASASSESTSALNGLFRINGGVCGDKGATGSYFRMVQPGGTVDTGPFVTNGDSPCTDKTWTVLTPGTDGGLRTGSYQPEPIQPFDTSGNATSALITKPQRWFAVQFGLASNKKDPQTKAAVPAPHIDLANGALTGDLSALAASWNAQQFNQGAPKPGGARPGNTVGPRGTFDPETKAYTLEWSSQIQGGPFNNFTGVWHLQGKFEPA